MSRQANKGGGVPTPLPEVLVLGCEGAGKSCLVRQCRWQEGDDDVSLAAAPTNGIERDELRHQQCSFVLKEIGGSMKTTWSSYYATCAAVVFVFDVSNVFQLAEAGFELATLMYSDTIRAKPIILVLNKTDASGALSRSDLQHSLRLDDLLASPRGGSGGGGPAVSASEAAAADVTIIECSAVQPRGITQLLDTIVKALQHTNPA